MRWDRDGPAVPASQSNAGKRGETASSQYASAMTIGPWRGVFGPTRSFLLLCPFKTLEAEVFPQAAPCLLHCCIQQSLLALR